MKKTTPRSKPLRQEAPHVIIVEDNDDTAHALSVVFSTSGYGVSVAHTVHAAIEACRALRAERGAVADLMLLDLTLPDGDGLTALARATAAGAAPRVTVALTGHDDAAIVAQCRAAGCVDVMLKPVSLTDLVARANAWTR
jgi:DNA-binding response OmpR family regulator